MIPGIISIPSPHRRLDWTGPLDRADTDRASKRCYLVSRPSSELPNSARTATAQRHSENFPRRTETGLTPGRDSDVWNGHDESLPTKRKRHMTYVSDHQLSTFVRQSQQSSGCRLVQSKIISDIVKISLMKSRW